MALPPFPEKNSHSDEEASLVIARKSWNHRMLQMGWGFSIFGTLFVLILVYGAFAGWFNLRGYQGESQVGLALEVNTDEVEESAAAVQESVEKTGEAVAVMSETNLLTGEVVNIGMVGGNHRISVAPEKTDKDKPDQPLEQVEIVASEHTTYLGEAQSAADLKAGDKVRIAYREEDGSNFALKITEEAAP